MQQHSAVFIGKRALTMLALLVLLSACSAPAPPPAASGAATTTASPAPSTAGTAPSSLASAAPTPSAAPSLAASAAPDAAASAAPSLAASAAPDTAEGPLPAPLLYLRDGQIVRLERDATTITQITDEQPDQADMLAVIDFDVSPVDGALVYVVQGRVGNILVRSDATGQQRTVLLASAPVTMPRWSPDGRQIAIQVAPPLENTAGPLGGVYLIPANGGEPQLLQPNDRTDPVLPSAEARGYMPHAWSPDGKRLLLSAVGLRVELCDAVVKDLESGALIPIQAPAGMNSGCADGQWSADGETIYIGMARPGPQPPVPGLWQADPRTGAITPFIQGQPASGSYTLVSNPRPVGPGTIYTYVAAVEAVPEPYSGVTTQYQLYEVSQTGQRALREGQFGVIGRALWAPDHSGSVVDLPDTEGGDVMTAWVPVAGGPVVRLGRFLGEARAWAR